MINYLQTFDFSSLAPSAKIVCPCPDQYVGFLNDGTFESISPRKDIDYCVGNGINNNELESPIIILLESPHVSEFDPITLNPLGVAMGCTGHNFKKYFDRKIFMGQQKATLMNGKHSIVFMNAVQYQCSLGNKLSGKGSYANKKTRDFNFLACLENANSCDVQQRIQAVNPVLVVNLCTIGLEKNNLNSEVNRILQGMNINYTYGTHPSRWNNPQDRRIM